MNDIPITAQELRRMNPNALPERAASFGKKSFWYYTRLSTADKILNSKRFRVSNLGDMNDLDEVRLHEIDKERVFALCFCNSDSEKIPMWYLYSGIAGNGAALGLTPLKLLKMIASLKMLNGLDKEDREMPLNVGVDVELRFGWVYYCKKDSPGQVLYRNRWYRVDDATQFEEGNYFLKAYPWEYEREFRIVLINHSATPLKAIYIPIPEEVCTAVKLRLAPELNAEKYAKLSGLEYIGKDPRCKPQYSKLSINMNLFHRNRNSLPDYLRTEFAKDAPDFSPEELCNLIREAKRCATGKTTAQQNLGCKENWRFFEYGNTNSC